MSGMEEIVFDIETIADPVTQDQLEEWRAGYSPPSNYKSEEAIGRHRQAEEQKWIMRGALELGRARVASIAIGCIYDNKVTDLQSKCSEDEREVVKWWVDAINSYDGPTEKGNVRIIGFNSRSFDMPILARAMALYGYRFEHPLSSRDHIDLFKWPLERLCGLKKAARIFRIEQDPDVEGMHGGKVASLWEDRAFEKIAAYNEDDVRITGELYIKLSGAYAI